MYACSGAERLLKAFRHYATASDSHMGRSALLEGIPLCATFPNLVVLRSELNVVRLIGGRVSDKSKKRNSVVQYPSHRWKVIRLSAEKSL